MSATDKPCVEAVIFDLGGVLIAHDIDLALKQLSSLVRLPLSELQQRFFGPGCASAREHSRAVAAFERGQISSRHFHRHLQEMVEYPLPYSTFEELWNSIFTGEIAPNVALARVLMGRQGFKVGLLSNTNEVHYDFLRQRMQILGELPYTFASHQIGERKPDPAAYNYVLQKMNVPAARAAFVDDYAENVAAAEAVGMHGIRATDPAAVHAGLARLGLI